jgi:hypothetical protein
MHKSFGQEAKKVRGFVAVELETLTSTRERKAHHFRFSRLPKVKPGYALGRQSPNLFSSARILLISEQEKKGESEGWGRSAMHAHQCCANQKHPAFVHLQQLLVRGSNLNETRVNVWKFRAYLHAAKKLESIVNEQLERANEPHKKRTIELYCEQPPAEEEEKPLDTWSECAPVSHAIPLNTNIF